MKNGLKLEDQKDAKKFLKEANQETRDTLKELREKRILEGTGAGILRYVYTKWRFLKPHAVGIGNLNDLSVIIQNRLGSTLFCKHL